MNENETNPQRSEPTTELPPVVREQSDSSPGVAPVSDAPTAPVPTTPAPQPAPPAPAPQPAAPAAAPSPYPPPSPWQHPDRVQQHTWPGNTGYTAPIPVAAAAGAPAPAPTYGAPPPDGGLPPHGPVPPGQPPIWAQQPGADAQPPQRRGRFGKVAMLGVAALVLMAGSGIAGGAVALAIDDSTTTVNRTYTAAPVIDSADLPKIAAQVENSVVSITTGNGEGSGVILSADGYILTNNHVVEGAQGDKVTVNFADGKTASATIKGTDPRTDLAVIKADGVSGLTAAKLGDSDAMQVGDTVLAIGSPLGLQGSVTSGIISAKDRTIQTGNEQQQNPFQQQQSTPVTSISGLLQTDAPINPGNSGGALVNTKGEVIGINTAIATSGSSTGNIGVGFAIPSNKAKDVAEALRNGEKVSHPSLGVSVNTAPNGGAVIGSVNPNSPAEKGGLKQGDVITKFGDKTINESDDLIGAVQSGKVGDQVQVTYTRNGQEQTATVTLAEAS